ncbi:vomeronasal type-2 receptor 26-like [Meriones unguiculatus]|uniref:vomeronasal type-2 receptor 26-like n=1 Tax=Meriones unguiculatus TaxID=10047 RepID=UPI00293E2BC8|nr:vomeronasal type-2 receptor 26-like [Meriones unguiculatus]
MSLPLLGLILFLQPVYTSMEISLLPCDYYWEPSTYMEADIILGTFIPIHIPVHLPQDVQNLFESEPSLLWRTFLLKWKNYQYMLSLYFAIEEINKDSNLLPNMTLGFHIYNAFNSNKETLEGPLMWLSGRSEHIPNYKCKTQHNALGIISGTKPEFSASIATLSELYKVPQVTYGPFDSMLSDKDTFPSLYQMSTKDRALAQGLISLLLHFGWKWVGLIVSDDQRGREFLSDLKVKMVSEDICVAFTEKLPDNWKSSLKYDYGLLNLKQHTGVNVNLFYGDIDDLLFFCVDIHIFLTRKKVWILAKPQSPYLESIINEKFVVINLFSGSFSFSKKRTIPGFKHFLEALTPSHYPGDVYFSKFWIDNFNCSPLASLCGNHKPCAVNISLKTKDKINDVINTSEPSYSIWSAVYAVAHALNRMLLSKTEMGSKEDRNTDWLLPWQLHRFLRKIKFINTAGDEISFDENKNIMETYDIQNFIAYSIENVLLLKVGEFVFKNAQDQGFFINEVLIQWPSNFKETPQSVCTQSCGPGFWKVLLKERLVCCFSCAFCPDQHISNQTDQQECIPCPIQEYPNPERNQCLPKKVTFLSFEDPLGIALAWTALCFSVSTIAVLGIFLKHRDSAIVKANNRTLSYILLISILLCFLCSFLFIGLPNTTSCILQQITFALVFTLAISTVLSKTITVILAFRVMKPGRTMRRLFVSGVYNAVIPVCVLIQLILSGVWLGTSPPYTDRDAHSEYDHIIILCNKGSVTAFYCVLAYLGTLALGSFTVAFLVRNLPDTFNEAKFLTFSMLVFCSVWVTFIPVYLSTKGKAMVAVEVFSILASSAGLLGCIFFPKCYIILLKPDKNSLRCLKNKKIAYKN